MKLRKTTDSETVRATGYTSYLERSVTDRNGTFFFFFNWRDLCMFLDRRERRYGTYKRITERTKSFIGLGVRTGLTVQN